MIVRHKLKISPMFYFLCLLYDQYVKAMPIRTELPQNIKGFPYLTLLLRKYAASPTAKIIPRAKGSKIIPIKKLKVRPKTLATLSPYFLLFIKNIKTRQAREIPKSIKTEESMFIILA